MSDLRDGTSTPREWTLTKLAQVLSPEARRVLIRGDSRYRRVGVRWYAQGPFIKDEVQGASIRSRYAYVVREGDFVYNRLFAWKGSFGVIPRSMDGAIASGEFPLFTPDKGRIDAEYLWRRLSLPDVWRVIEHKSTGSTRTSRLRFKEHDFLAMEIALPPISEQRAIAHVLRAVQEANDAAEADATALRDVRKSLVQHLFAHGPVPITQIASVRQRDTAIGILPDAWEVVRLGDLFEIQQGKALNGKAMEGGKNLPFLRTSNVLWGRIELSAVDYMSFSQKERERLELRSGDLLVCEGGDIGRAAVWENQLQECYHQNHVHRLRRRSDQTVPGFYMYWLQAALTQFGLYAGAGNRTTIPNLSKSRLASFAVPRPPNADQELIVRCLATVDASVSAFEARRAALRALFNSLLHHLITGDIRVQDLNILNREEPAA